MAETYIKDPSSGAWLVKGQAGDVPITDPVTLRGLATGQLPYSTEAMSLSPRVTSPTTTQASQPQGATTPLPGPAGALTGSAPAGNPYTIFNQNMAGLLTGIQKTQTEGAATLGSNIATATNVGVSPNGAVPFDPNVSASVQSTGRENLSNAFQPVIANMNTRLENTTNSLNALSGNVKSMMAAYAPQVLQPGQSLVSPDGKVIKQGHEYSPQMNPNTGLLDGFDVTTGSWSSEDMNIGGQTTTPVLSRGGATDSTIIAGVELGTTQDGIGPWATDPNAVHQVNNIYNDLKNNIPAPSALAYDQYIKNNGGGAVTGNMIISSAKLHNIDPNLLAAILNNESDFGNSGVSTKDNNPGGITYTGTLGQMQGTARPQSEGGYYVAYKSLAQGVDAVATALQKRIVSTEEPKKETSNVGGQFSPIASTKLALLPKSMQSYADAGPKGVIYINDDRVPANLKDTLKIMSSRAGIPYLQGSDASAIKSIGVVYQSLDGMTKLVDETLNSGVLGGSWDIAKTLMHNATWGNAFPELSKFNSYRDTAIKAVQGLAGGQGSGLRINASEIEANLQNLAGSSDTIANATAKITGITSMLDKQLAATFPYIANSSTGGSTVRVKLSNGQTGTVSISEYDPSTMTKI
jgi:hypothetical protein